MPARQSDNVKGITKATATTTCTQLFGWLLSLALTLSRAYTSALLPKYASALPLSQLLLLFLLLLPSLLTIAAFLVAAASANVFSAALPVDTQPSRGDTALKRDATTTLTTPRPQQQQRRHTTTVCVKFCALTFSRTLLFFSFCFLFCVLRFSLYIFFVLSNVCECASKCVCCLFFFAPRRNKVAKFCASADVAHTPRCRSDTRAEDTHTHTASARMCVCVTTCKLNASANK